jgi:hypothetical protein
LDNGDLLEAVRLFCGFTQTHEIVIECCYLYSYAIRLLIVDNLSRDKVYELVLTESNRRARVTGFSTVKYWIENDVEVDDEMPTPSYRPI